MTERPMPTFMDRLEETVIAGSLGAMTLLTFANVVARKAFNSNILWGLELTVFLFAWLVLLGASYAVKKGLHLGVDVIILMVPPPVRKLMALLSAGICVAFSFLLLKGAWDYWANFANLPATEGRWFPLGFEKTFLAKGWYEVNDIPLPAALRWMEAVFNDGETYEKLPRLLPYAVLPLAMSLLLLRFVEAAAAIWNGSLDRVIAGHEAEADIQAINKSRRGAH